MIFTAMDELSAYGWRHVTALLDRMLSQDGKPSVNATARRMTQRQADRPLRQVAKLRAQ